MIGQIYKNAMRVITYTGQGSEDPVRDERGMQLLANLSDNFQRNTEFFARHLGPSAIRRNRAQLHVQTLSTEIAKTSTPDDWSWLLELCFGEWSTRLWIVQEQLLNAEIWMSRGRRLVSWADAVVLPLLWYLDLVPGNELLSYWGDSMLHVGPYWWPLAVSAYSMWYRRSPLRSQETKRSLFENIWDYGGLECQNPRDRIFALLGVSSDATDLAISIEYKKSSAEVFREATAAMLCRNLCGTFSPTSPTAII